MKFVVEKPILGAISTFGCRSINAMTLAVNIPFFASISIFNRRSINAMQIVIKIPVFVAVVANFYSVDYHMFIVPQIYNKSSSN